MDKNPRRFWIKLAIATVCLVRDPCPAPVSGGGAR
jgi:hypothetical protein